MKNIHLNLPCEISADQTFYGVCIKNDNLENIGLKHGRLALIVRSDLKQGDLAAFTIIESDEVVIGFYSELFGMICLEDRNFEVEIYNQNEIEYFGKIIGYGENPIKQSMPINIVPISVGVMV